MRFNLPIRLITCVAVLVVGATSTLAQELSFPEGMSLRSIRKILRADNVPTKSLEELCPTVKPLTKALLKNAYPGHIQLTDPRATGFAFVCGPDCPSKFPVNAYYSDGTLAFKLGYYGTWEGNGRPRAYCGAGGVGRCSVSSVTRNARKSGRDGKVYLAFSKRSCRSAIPGRRNGSPF